MGREIRRVAKGWEHPKYLGRYTPLWNHSFRAAAQEWLDKFNQAEDKIEFLEKEDRSPDADKYMPDWKNEEKTCWQMYETVSEGTPVTPVFETKEALVDYLVEHGTLWDQRNVAEGWQDKAQWSREAAQRMVDDEWAPSAIMKGGKLFTPKDMDRGVIHGKEGKNE